MKTLLKTGFAAACLGFVAVASAATLELKDGSRIQGEIRGFENGMYTVVSPSIGTVQVAQSNLVRIVYGGGGSSSTGGPTSSEIQQMQARLAQDPATVSSIMSLQSDPQVMAILKDPEIVRALQDGDYMSLLDNPKIRALENDPQVKQLIEQHAH